MAAYGLALWTRFTLEGALPPGFPYLTFFPAIILTAFLAGTWPGILCAALSGLSAWYWFIPPFRSFEVTHNTAIALGFFLFICAVDILIIDMMARATERLALSRARSQQLADSHATMFTELQHRVANNLGFVASLLALQKKKAAADPATAPALFDDAIRRIEVMGRIHRRLHAPASLEQPIGDYLRELCAELIEVGSAKGIICLIEADDIRLDLPRLTALSLIVSEVMTNSLKHAFHGRDTGTITLDLKQLHDGRYHMTIADDGPGFAAAKPSPNSLGLKIVRGLAAQLGGEIAMPERPRGAVTELRFAA
ncbi:sensor histidine kinase [Sphingoaurantiacus capsulatus]|uniref:histidine kinase n=1 Tax=Sphingoaurantiacus capsulatus TaxID=1771310 RepID=A0ABV7X7Y0_9SPHN